MAALAVLSLVVMARVVRKRGNSAQKPGVVLPSVDAVVLGRLLQLELERRSTRWPPSPYCLSMADGRAIYAMAAVERIIGESADTIRQWEDRYGRPSPSRSPGGQLLYSRDDVEQLRWLAHELAAGREPSGTGTADPAQLDHASRDAAGPQVLVLLAERDPRAADLEEYFLRTEGYHVEVCWSAHEAEAGAAAMQPDVAVVELTLSSHAGLDLCRRLHEISDTAVVAVSGLDSRDQALAAGADAFLLKPLDPLVLISTIKDLLGASAFLRPREGTPDVNA